MSKEDVRAIDALDKFIMTDNWKRTTIVITRKIVKAVDEMGFNLSMLVRVLVWLYVNDGEFRGFANERAKWWAEKLYESVWRS